MGTEAKNVKNLPNVTHSLSFKNDATSLHHCASQSLHLCRENEWYLASMSVTNANNMLLTVHHPTQFLLDVPSDITIG